MSTALHQLTISEITCRNLRSADMFGKNDVYVVFRVGTKKVKTHHIKNAGKHASFDEILTMNLSDSDLEHGIDVGAYDYDVGSSDDLLDMAQDQRKGDCSRGQDGRPRAAATSVGAA